MINIHVGLRPKPRRTERHRGYRDQGRLSDFDAKLRKEANSQRSVLQELEREYQLRTQDELERATQILLLEKDGYSPEQIAESGRKVDDVHGSQYDEDRPFSSLSDDSLHRHLDDLRKKEKTLQTEESGLQKADSLAKIIRFLGEETKPSH